MTEVMLKPKEMFIIEHGHAYTLLKRYADVQPYVVAFGYDPNSGSWMFGNYFDDLKKAVEFFYEFDTPFSQDEYASAWANVE